MLQTDTVEYDDASGARRQAIRLVIANNGGGFSSRILSRAFKPYVTTKAEGAGLGLAMVKEIMDEYGTRIELHNRQSGTASGTSDTGTVGAQVSILFVKLAQHGRQSRYTQRKNMATILIVDDEIGIRELFSKIFGDEEHIVEVIEDAQRAREYHANAMPSLALLDIWMPDTDGVMLLKEWASQGLLTMSVIMMSDHVTIDTAVEATKIDALNFLEKPIALQKLLTAAEQDLPRSKGEPRSTTPVATPMAGLAGAIPNATAADIPAVLKHTDINDVPTRIAESGGMQFLFDMPLYETHGPFERAYSEYHLQREGGSMTHVTEKIGLERTHLYRKLKQLGIELSRNKGEPTA